MITNLSVEDTEVDLNNVNVSTNIDSMSDDEDCSISTTKTVTVGSICTPDFPRSKIIQSMYSKSVEEEYG